MTADLVPFDVTQLPSTSVGSDSMFSELAKGQDFLSRLQLFTKGKAVDRRLVRGGEYGVPRSADDIDVIGDEAQLLVFARRAKAIDMTDLEALITSYDPDCDEFKRIAAKASEKESHCMYGPSFLVYEESRAEFMEFFCGSKSARIASKDIYPFLLLTPADIEARGMKNATPHGPIPMTLTSKLVVKGSFSWYVPVATRRSTPIEMPPMDRIRAEMVKFLTPQGDGPELAPEPKKAGKKRAR